MRYSYEYKRKCVELYREGKWPETPTNVRNEKDFHAQIRIWVRMEEENGSQILRPKTQNTLWTAEDKLVFVNKVLAGDSIKSTAISAGISRGMLYRWVQKYKSMGYNGLVNKKKGRPPKESSMKQREISPKPLTESEREELIRLRAEIAYMKAENEVIKKEIALREEKQAALLKAKKQRLFKNSGKKDIT